MEMISQQQKNSSSHQFTEEQMKRYFAKIPPKVIGALIIGGAVFLCGIVSQTSLILVAGLVVALVATAIIAIIVGGSKPTDEEYDQWVDHQAQMLLSRAPVKLGLDPSQITRDPLEIHGFVLPGMKDARKYRADELRWKIGRDGKPRFSVNIYTYFFPADHHIAAFVSDINALNQAAHNEEAEEYFYKDIVGATANDEQDHITIKEKQYQYRVQSFALKINSGDSIGVTVNATPMDNKQNIPSFHVPDSGVDSTIAQLRMLLRDKKTS
jgi:hypothetical protein